MAAILLCASPASAAGPWEAAANLSASGGDGFFPQAGIDAGGAATAYWDCFNCKTPATVQSSSRPAGGPWSPLEARETSEENTNGAYAPDLAVAPSGFAAGTWWRGGFGRNHIIKAAVRSGGVWSAPEEVTTEAEHSQEGEVFTGAYFPHIAADSKGDAVVVWQECFSPKDVPTPEEEEKGEVKFGGTACATLGLEEVGRYVMYAAYRPAGGAWSAPQSLSKATETAIKAKVAIDENGDAIVVWEGDELPFETTGKAKVIYAGVLRAGQTSWSVEQISPSGDEAGEPAVAFDAAGNATALFHARKTTESELLVESATLSAGASAWSSTVQVSDSGQSTFEPQLAVDPAGNAVAIWRGNTTNRIEGRTRNAGLWSPTQVFLSPEGFSREPRLAIDSAGDAVAVWRYSAAKKVIQASLLPVGGTWSAPTELSDPEQSAEEPDVAMNAKGSAVAIWRHSDGVHQIVQSSFLRPTIGFQSTSIPASAGTDREVKFSASPTSLWPGLHTTWSFGDGTTATGNSPSHTYTKPGTYRVTVTSTDGPGNSVSSSGQIVIENGIAKANRTVAVRGTRGSVGLTCSAVGTCEGTVKIALRYKGRRTLVGKAGFAIAPGKSRTLTVALGRRTKNLLAKARGHKLNATLEGDGVQRGAIVLRKVGR